ncbi:uncharacterized protein [Chironomus tepperi]|uniref:uncharacterized protein isoform X2 n=1 Tax=Chironomus tepperi TaxID=113505 RepID=UPI00391FC52C
MLFLITYFLAIHSGLAGSIPAAPENITVTFINPTSVRVSWQQPMDTAYPIEKYDVTYKPTDARVIAVVAGNSEAVVLGGLIPDTQYQLVVAAIWSGRKYRSRAIIFRTLGETEESPRTSPQQDFPMDGPPNPPLADPRYREANISVNSTTTTRALPTIRGIEVGIVVLVLFVWAGAIALFFNRWGKIRMLLPYQPDYKQDQLKVPGTGVCAAGACNGQHSHQVTSLTHIHPIWNNDEPSTVIADRCHRARINSAIFVSSEGRGFDSIEFIRRYGSQSVLCRKAKSAENIPAGNRNRRFSENPSSSKLWESEECRNSPAREKIEMVECYNDPSLKIASIPKRTPKKLLAALPTLSISGPSPAPSRNTSPTSNSPTKEEDEEQQNFL